MRALRTDGVLRALESVTCDRAAAAANARGNYHELRAAGGKSRAECRHSVYNANGVAWANDLSVFR